MRTFTFHIQDMDCAEEVAILRRVLLPLVATEEHLQFNTLSRTLRVQASTADLAPAQVAAAIAPTGMRAVLMEGAAGERSGGIAPHAASGAKAHTHGDAIAGCSCCGGHCATGTPGQTLWQKHGRVLLCVLSGFALVAGFAVQWAASGSLVAALAEEQPPSPVAFALWGAAIIAGIWRVLPRALFAVRSLRPDMNLLMVVAVLGAVGIGNYFEGASVAFLFAVANQLESWSVGRARSAIKALLDISPETALLLDVQGGEPRPVPVAAVAVGSRVLVRAGDRIALDGVVVRGTSGVDQSPITGESVPVAKTVGDTVFAGTINGEGVLEVQTTLAASETTLARILRMVEEAQSRKAQAVQWVDRFALWYTPAMMVLAVLIAVVPPLLFGGSWSAWFYDALVVLVIACPCALVISTPVTIVSGLTSAARRGVLIKGGSFLELPARLTAITFDKTGTLTEGRPVVTGVAVAPGHDVASVLAVAAALEQHSTHPLARAVLDYATAQGVVPLSTTDQRAVPGFGAEALIDGARYGVGNRRFFTQSGGVMPAWAGDDTVPGTQVLVWHNDQLLGVLGVEDRLRDTATDAVRRLRQTGVRHVVMLSGDNRVTAASVAAQLGGIECRADLFPDDKTAAVEALTAEGNIVAMVGDGINDAPALAAAHVGIAMGGIGSDAAMETADIALMSGDLRLLPWLVDHSRRTMSIIRQNIGFALGLKVVFLLLTLAQYSSLWLAIVADIGGSFAVIFNGLRMLRARPLGGASPSAQR